MSNYTPTAPGDGLRARVQRFGSRLAGMVMPNIGAFIAWGLITALFIPDGWLPNKDLAEMVGPMIIFLLPILIGFKGGKLVHGHRGGVVGAVATMGVIVGTEVPMFLGAMIMGPLAAFIIKKFDEAIEGKVKPGFEMLIDNFSAGIVGMVLAVVGYKGAGPIVEQLTTWLGNGVETLVDNNL
ncbi:MAG: PTS transporter subunit EIIC, partial [Aeromicrobium sp.]